MRSRSDRDRDRSHSRRNRDESDAAIALRFGAPLLTREDYYVRSGEFKAWLSLRGVFLDEVSSSEARRYFDRFVRRWNAGRLQSEFYSGHIRSSGSSAGTRHTWGFTKSKAWENEREKLAAMRDTVDTMTNGESRGAIEARDAETHAKTSRDEHLSLLDQRASRTIGSSSTQVNRDVDRQHTATIARIASMDRQQRERQNALDEYDAIQGCATGRDRMLERKRQINADKRAFANRRDDGLEMDDRELYDPAPTADHALAETASSRHLAKQQGAEQRSAENSQKLAAIKRKDAQTMAMFRALAAERFGKRAQTRNSHE